MRSSDVKGDNKVAEAAKEEKGNAISAEPDIDAKKAEEANKHRKLFLECGKELRYIYVIRGVGAGIIMLGTVIIFVSALLFYRQAHCDVQWSQWTPCTDLTDVSTVRVIFQAIISEMISTVHSSFLFFLLNP
ncbi:unnamed protein product [Toxocara canis]|uniref:Cation-transporting ATPase n=1 Tax=Toxocara canis TaxID=6265 RepID=A0A183V6Q9_TOXCA|nr:unnamed protein product [Toxocara canis]